MQGDWRSFEDAARELYALLVMPAGSIPQGSVNVAAWSDGASRRLRVWLDEGWMGYARSQPPEFCGYEVTYEPRGETVALVAAPNLLPIPSE